MGTCKQHPGQQASLQCRLCHTPCCHRCGQAGDPCPACHQGLLRPLPVKKAGPDAPRQACTNHPGVHARLKLCASCERWYCGDCIAFGGICTGCNEEHVAALKPVSQASGHRHHAVKRKRMPGKLLLGRILGGLKNLVLLLGGGALLWTGWNTLHTMQATRPNARPAIDTRLQGGAAGGALEALGQLQALRKLGTRDAGGAARPQGPDQTSELMRQAGLDDGGLPAEPGADPVQQQPAAPRTGAISEAETLAAMQALMQQVPGVQRAAPVPRAATEIRLGIEGLRRGQTVRGLVPVKVRLTGGSAPLNVELHVNGSWVGMANHPPYQFDWDTSTQPPGRYKVQAIATDPAGANHASSPVWVTVAP